MGGLAVLFLLGLYLVLTVLAIIKVKPLWVKGLILLAALLIPTADAIYGRIKLQQMCKTEGGLKVYRVAQGVEGFMGYADEEMITKYGYQFVESCDVSMICYKFSKQNEAAVKEYSVTPKSKYRLRQIDDNSKGAYSRGKYIIEDITTEEVLAADTQLTYNGGWAERLLAIFSDAGGGNVAWCSNIPYYPEVRIKNLITSTLKHSGE
jgi:hypothetical protein